MNATITRASGAANELSMPIAPPPPQDAGLSLNPDQHSRA